MLLDGICLQKHLKGYKHWMGDTGEICLSSYVFQVIKARIAVKSCHKIKNDKKQGKELSDSLKKAFYTKEEEIKQKDGKFRKM